MKKIIISLLIVIILLIIIEIFCMTDNQVLEENVVATIISNNDSITNEDDIKFDPTKMKTDASYVAYQEEQSDFGNAGINIEVRDGKPYLSTDIENETYKFLFSDVTEPIKDKEITGFNSKVSDVYFAFIGNGDPQPIILFLMEDGNVEFADSGKMLELKKYESFGKIEELSNIVKFVTLSANDVSEDGELMSGFMTVAAIDKDGYSYDISHSKTLQENMKSNY